MSSGGTGHHGGGWVSWLVPAVMIAYAVAVVWAYNNGLSPWVFVFGTLGPVGILWAGYHFGHVVGHWFHSFLVQAAFVVLGCWAAVTMATPVLEWRSALTVGELWCDLTLGSLGILFLAYEVGHMLHHHRGWQTVIGVGAAALLVALYLGRPAGAVIAPVPPLAHAPPAPTRTNVAPGFSRPSAGGGASVASSSGTGTLECSELSSRAREAARSKGLCP